MAVNILIYYSVVEEIATLNFWRNIYSHDLVEKVLKSQHTSESSRHETIAALIINELR